MRSGRVSVSSEQWWLARRWSAALVCTTSLGKLCASDHAMNAIDEMSALNRDLKKFFDEHGAAYPVWQALETEAGRYLQ